MAAAYSAALNGASVMILERNEKLGKKLYLTGKGRCNFTNVKPVEDFLDSVFVGRNFAYTMLYEFDPEHTIELIESAGVKTKIERGDRAFPESDKASDITKAFNRLLVQNGVEIRFNAYVEDLMVEDGQVVGLKVNGETLSADCVIVCTGGLSYKTTGSDGNGYELLSRFDHNCDPCSPALVSLQARESWVSELAGLSLKNVGVTLLRNGKVISSQFGELLFTHTGVSGPCILTLSCFVYDEKMPYEISIDLKPALDDETLNTRILRELEQAGTKNVKAVLETLLPKSLAALFPSLWGVSGDKKVNQITYKERMRLISLLKDFKLSITSKAGYEEAVITNGGISLKEINPKNMASKRVEGLYLAGEIINLHGFTGGYNLQLAFSSGILAGRSAALD
jgi:predicted Rossmann fold flavoprotein